MTSPGTPFTIPQLVGYFGGKGGEGTVQTIINRIPPHHSFISPFLGHCAVLRHIKPAEFTLGIDLDAYVVKCWQRSAPAHVTLQQSNGLGFIRQMVQDSDRGDLDRNTFLFLDPPYLEGTTRGIIRYKHLLNYDEHLRMLQDIVRLKCSVMLCGLPNVLNDNMLKGWHTLQYRNKTRRGMQWEQIWMNYAKPERLHDTRYIGDTFRERERIKRTVRALQRIIEQHPESKRERSPIERQHIIEAIKAANP
jgi:site-specific DNA-adenine methylase